MKSIQTKIIFLSLFCTILVAIVVLGVSFYNTNGILDEDSEQIMNLLVEARTKEMNETIGSIEQTVDILYHFVLEQLGDVEALALEGEYYEEFLSKVRELAENAAQNTNGSIGVYLHFNPELFSPTSGFYMIRPTGEAEFKEHEVTDLSQYDKSDISNTGWYYQPIEAGEAIWMTPYKNANVGTEVVSYVIPIYCGDTEVGIIGMDIDMKVLCKKVASISVYESGYAFLMDSKGNIVYHKDHPAGLSTEEFTDEFVEVGNKIKEAQNSGKLLVYQWEGMEKQLKAGRLYNDMYLMVTVPTKEITTPQWQLVKHSVVLILVVLVLCICIIIKWVKSLIRPLRQLTDAAKKVEKGELDVTIECKTKDEVGVLARSFQQTVRALNEYIDYINQLAYTDAMTGLLNKTAYKKQVSTIEKNIADGNAEFALAVLDINNLKRVNDTYGHEIGDKMIMNAATLMREVFGMHVFRVGGDEFVVVFQNEELACYQQKLQDFNEQIEMFNKNSSDLEYKLQIAVGADVYRKEDNKQFSDVFRCADTRMYENKQKLKSKQSDA